MITEMLECFVLSTTFIDISSLGVIAGVREGGAEGYTTQIHWKANSIHTLMEKMKTSIFFICLIIGKGFQNNFIYETKNIVCKILLPIFFSNDQQQYNRLFYRR